MPIPVVGRLTFRDYERIALTIFILGFETILRFVVFVVPVSLLDWLRFRVFSRIPRLFRGFHDEDDVGSGKISRFAGCRLTKDLVRAHGYACEEHNVFTTDGYLLVLHRILKTSDTTPEATSQRPPVLLIHGCMMSSEVWVCLRSAQKCLPFLLLEAGYDVWLGNIRGNKYCQKHTSLSPAQNEFWNFSLDETVQHDLPRMIEYILSRSPRFTQITYVGFSQGSSQGFAMLSLNPEINKKVSLMIALAATTKPMGMTNRLVQAMTKASPETLYLFFSRRIFIRSVNFWCNLLSPRAYAFIIDRCQGALFNWSSARIRPIDKYAAYQHLYAFTSCKLIVHWFQIMRSGAFQMYDEGSPVRVYAGHVVPRYALDTITTKIALFLGGRDTLVDNEYTERHLRSVVHVTKAPEYEHLDFLWAHDVDTRIYHGILDLLRAHPSA